MKIEFKNERRGYTLLLNRDLFGAFILYRRWYGLHNHRGGMKEQVFMDESEAMREVGRIVRTRLRNGYRKTAF